MQQDEKQALIEKYTAMINDIEQKLQNDSVSEDTKEELRVELFYHKWWIDNVVNKKTGE